MTLLSPGFFVTALATTFGLSYAACRTGGEIELPDAVSRVTAAGSGGAPLVVANPSAGRGGNGGGGMNAVVGGTGGGSGVGGLNAIAGAGGAGGEGEPGGTGGVSATGGNGGNGGLGGMASAAPFFGLAQTFAVLGGTTITNTGATLVTGDIGVSSPGVAVTGFPPGVIALGTIQIGTATPNQAQADAGVAYGALAGKACNTPLTGMDLGGRTLAPGVYCFTSSAQLTGQLVLDGKNDPNATFVFQISTTLTTATGSSVVLINGGKADNLFWQVGSDATFGMGIAFVGNVLAYTSITMVSGASLRGRALARAAVTLDGNVMSVH